MCWLYLEFAQEKHTGIPWQAGLKRGEALEEDQDAIVVKEEGYYFLYGQVKHYHPPIITQVTVLTAFRAKDKNEVWDKKMNFINGLIFFILFEFSFCDKYEQSYATLNDERSG